jgi:hypothetical protein
MPYTYRSLAFVWLIMSALFAVTVSGGVPAGWWLVLLLAVALLTPMLVLGRSARVTATSPERPLVAAVERKPSPVQSDSLKVFTSTLLAL